MANEEHLKILKQGVDVWNQWRKENPDIRPNLREVVLVLVKLNLQGADLSRADLFGANLNIVDFTNANLSEAILTGADLIEAKLRGAVLSRAILYGVNLRDADLSKAELSKADLVKANLTNADLSGTNLIQANLSEADLGGANLIGADLRGANLSGANLTQTDLSGADLSGAILIRAILVETDLTNATLAGCSIYGISVWDVNLERANQTDLIISRYPFNGIRVDNLEVAQFIYLLLHNEKIRHIIDTITSKVVLILGRFTPERKKILDAIRDELRQRDYLPILFDFEKPSSRDLTETISTLAHIARFIIADITDAKSIPAELERIVPGLPSVPVQPLISTSDYEYALFEHIRRYQWVLEPYQYDDLDGLLDTLKEKVIDPTELKAKQIKEKG